MTFHRNKTCGPTMVVNVYDVCTKRRRKHVYKMHRTQIYGQYHRKVIPIRVDRIGRLITQPKGHSHDSDMSFREKRQTVVATDKFVPLPLENISHAVQYVYLVRNIGDVDAEVFVQVGTDHESLADDLEGVLTVPVGQTTIVTPLRFSKYIRLLYRTSVPNKKTKLLIVFQTQIIR